MMMLGATSNPLDAKFTIPGIGLVISVRSLLQTICVAADVDSRICTLINSTPAEACKTLVGYGDQWLHDRIEEAFEVMIAQVLEGIDCQAKNWKQIVFESIDVSFSNEGIAIEIDETAILQNVICAIARRAINLSLEAPINTAVRELKKACAKLSKSTPAKAPTSSSAPLTKKPTDVNDGWGKPVRWGAHLQPERRGLKVVGVTLVFLGLLWAATRFRQK